MPVSSSSSTAVVEGLPQHEASHTTGVAVATRRVVLSPDAALLRSLRAAKAKKVARLLVAAGKAHQEAKRDGSSADTKSEALTAAKVAKESTHPFLTREEEAPRCIRDAYALGSLLLADTTLMTVDGSDDPKVLSEAAATAHRALDLAILRGGGQWAVRARPILEAAAVIAETAVGTEAKEVQSESEGQKRSSKRRRCDPSINRDKDRRLYEEASPHYMAGMASAVIDAIPRVSVKNLTPDEFRERHLARSAPVIVTDAIDDWPAMGGGGHPGWADFDWIKSMASGRLVPVEVCAAADITQSYLTESWEQRVMSLGEYIDNFVVASETGGGERGYLAQHSLFDQIPQLRRHITPPAFCLQRLEMDNAAAAAVAERSTVAGGGDEDLVVDGEDGGLRTSAWFGPAGTVSPLHHDPYHNILAQVVGFKYIRLVSPEHSQRLYPRPPPIPNNSFVDLDNPDLERFPKYRDVPALQCVLGPGELLYLPRGWWHYVRSLSMSFSVSFFWGTRM